VSSHALTAVPVLLVTIAVGVPLATMTEKLNVFLLALWQPQYPPPRVPGGYVCVYGDCTDPIEVGGYYLMWILWTVPYWLPNLAWWAGMLLLAYAAVLKKVEVRLAPLWARTR